MCLEGLERVRRGPMWLELFLVFLAVCRGYEGLRGVARGYEGLRGI